MEAHRIGDFVRLSRMDDADEEIAALGRLMARAVAAEDFEEAARLRGEIDRLAGVDSRIPHGSTVGRGTPGAMGLGTDQASMRRPPGWKPPPRPDNMTTGVKASRERPKARR